jgi:hypothetical protein
MKKDITCKGRGHDSMKRGIKEKYRVTQARRGMGSA